MKPLICAFQARWGQAPHRYRCPLVRFAPARRAGYARQYGMLVAMVLLTACGGGRTAPERYTLTPGAIEAPACRGDVNLKIYEPNAAPGLDSWRIAVIDRPNHLTYYRKVAWSATASRMVQHALTDMLSQSDMFHTVSTDLDTVPAQYSLESTLAAFNTDLTGSSPRLRITLDAGLTGPEGTRPTRIRLSREADIAGRNMDAIVALFNEQMRSIGEELTMRLGKAIPACR